AALLLSAKPTLSRAQVRSLLETTADKIDPTEGDYRDGYSLQYGYGRLNAFQALEQAQATGRGEAIRQPRLVV
ncbi:MAG TPA: hypothetical protein PKE45_05535, partial [Caldilineaceae bacterium]|nr:hypothetical protein [Caldilineaceae bacterium]